MNDQLVISDHFATWCGPCKMMDPILKKMEERYVGKLVINKIDIDENQELTKKLNITSVPTLIFSRNNVELHKHEGAMSPAKLESIIKKYIGE